jgi:hypothetical protein
MVFWISVQRRDAFLTHLIHPNCTHMRHESSETTDDKRFAAGPAGLATLDFFLQYMQAGLLRFNAWR